MAQTAFAAWIQYAEAIGIFQYVLPFIFTFTVLYTILDKASGIVGGDRRTNVVISLVVSLFVVRFSAMSQFAIGTFYSNFFTSLAIILVGSLAALMVFGLVFRGNLEQYQDSWLHGLAILGAIAVLVVFVWVGGLNILLAGKSSFTLNWSGFGNVAGVIVIVGIILFFYWVLGGGGNGGDAAPDA